MGGVGGRRIRCCDRPVREADGHEEEGDEGVEEGGADVAHGPETPTTHTSAGGWAEPREAPPRPPAGLSEHGDGHSNPPPQEDQHQGDGSFGHAQARH